MTKKITIRKGQLGLLSRQGDYYQVLEAGEHRLPWFNVPEVLIDPPPRPAGGPDRGGHRQRLGRSA